MARFSAADCSFAYETVPVAEFKKWMWPKKSRPPTPVAASQDQGVTTPNGTKLKLKFCADFAKGNCDYASKNSGKKCPKDHLTNDQVKELRKKIKKAKQAANR